MYSKRLFLLSIAYVYVLCVAGESCNEGGTIMAGARPNIIVYFTDQQRWDTLGCYGQQLPISPVLDALAQEGTLFEHCFSCQPVCGPARACLQTGLYATQVNCHTNARILPLGIDTVARQFNAAGYQTAYIGKWHLASTRHQVYRTAAIPEERRGGYTYWMAADALEAISHGYNGYVFDHDMRRHDFVGHRVDCINAYAIDYIHKIANHIQEDDRPFFLFISQLDPHHQNDRNRYEGPDGSKNRFKNFVPPGDLHGQGGDWEENYPDYLGSCNLIDQGVGKLMDTLQSYGLADNTVLFYTSDHGCHFRTRNAEYKRSCHDASLRVPLIAWGGPFTGGGVRSELTSLIDLPATWLDVAGIAIPPAYRGQSLLPLLHGEQQARDVVFAQISEAETGRTIRTARYKYAVTAPVFDPDAPGSDVYVESHLYDLQHDPHELNNLVTDPALALVCEDLKQRLLVCMRHAGEPDARILPAS
jgi:arylsulfatase A-like enzyme